MRWQGFDDKELRVIADALRWRASQLRTYVALADAMSGTDTEEGEEELADTSEAQASLVLLERLINEVAQG